MFPCFRVDATFHCCGSKFCFRDCKNVSEFFLTTLLPQKNLLERAKGEHFLEGNVQLFSGSNVFKAVRSSRWTKFGIDSGFC